MLLMILAAALLLLMKPSDAHPRTVLQMRRFDTDGTNCVFEVVQTIPRSSQRNEGLEVGCDGKRIFHKSIEDGDVLEVKIFDGESGNGTFLAVRWERGLTADLTVVQITKNDRGPKAKVVYEYGGRHSGEAFENENVILQDVGARFEDGPWILSIATNVYEWREDRYVFVRSYTWHPKANWYDRYCIFANPKACPADVSDKRVLDEFEKPTTP